MKIAETMTREERRAAVALTTARRDLLILMHQKNRSAAETVAELIGRIGYQAARETIAEAVNARGSWDARISDASRAWAASIDTAADRETLVAHYLTTDEIHPAHVDQIAEAAAEYDREKPETTFVYDARRIRWFLLDAIRRDAQTSAVNACLLGHEAETRKEITAGYRRQISAIYDAWERGWCALEEAEAAEAAAAEEAPAEEIAADVVNVDDLRADLDTGDYGEYLNDYRDSSEYISDAINEIADNNTSIYYSDIMAFISKNPDSLADVIDEGLYDPSHGYDLHKHGQAAEYLTIERDIWDHLDDSLMLCALDFIRYDLGRETIPAELADLLTEWINDPGDRMDEIPDRIRDYFEDTEESEEE